MAINNKILNYIEAFYELWADFCLNNRQRQSSLVAFRPDEKYNSNIQRELQEMLADFRSEKPYELLNTLLSKAVQADDALKQAFQTLSFKAAINAAQVTLSEARESLESKDLTVHAAERALNKLEILKYKKETGVVDWVWSSSLVKWVTPELSVEEVKRRWQEWEKDKPRVEREIQNAKSFLSCLKVRKKQHIVSKTPAFHEAEYRCLLLHSLGAITQQFGKVNSAGLHQNKRPVQSISFSKQDNDTTIQAVQSLIINKERMAMKAVSKAGDLCAKYSIHLGGVRVDDDILKFGGRQQQNAVNLNFKKAVINGVQEELVLPSELKCEGTALFASARLRASAGWLAEHQDDVVKHRSPFLSFLKVLAFVLAPVPVGLYSYKTRGTPWFWLSHGDVLVSKVEKPLSVGSRPASGC
jgi:hypothetical protein